MASPVLYLRRGAAISEGGEQVGVPEDIVEAIKEAAEEHDRLVGEGLPTTQATTKVIGTPIRPANLDPSVNPYEGTAADAKKRLADARKEDPTVKPDEYPKREADKSTHPGKKSS